MATPHRAQRQVVVTLGGHTDDIIGLHLGCFPYTYSFWTLNLLSTGIDYSSHGPAAQIKRTSESVHLSMQLLQLQCAACPEDLGHRVGRWAFGLRCAGHFFEGCHAASCSFNGCACRAEWLSEPRTILVYDIKTWKVLHKLDCKARQPDMWQLLLSQCLHSLYTPASNGKSAGKTLLV